MDTARDGFLRGGYGGTSIESITDACGLSRASFYTYFPTKRDLLLALGEDAAAGESQLERRLAALGRQPALVEVIAWVADYFSHLDRHGAFVVVWQHAAADDDLLAERGTALVREAAQELGVTLLRLRGRRKARNADVVAEGLAVRSLLERCWQQQRSLALGIEDHALHRSAATLMLGAGA